MFVNVLKSGRTACSFQLLKNQLRREWCQKCNQHQMSYPLVAHIQRSHELLVLPTSQSEITHNNGRYFGTSQSAQVLKKSTYIAQEEEKPGVLTRILEGIGVAGSMKYNRFKIRVAGLNLYTSCADGIDVEQFFRVCNLPDTLHSWFRLVVLHVWMSLVRLQQEGSEGKYMKHYMVFSMWYDIQERGKQMGVKNIQMKAALQKMVEQFQGALFAYDEGILSDDRVLAAALWRNLFGRKCDDPERLAMMVGYVRQQIQYLDTLDSAQLLQSGKIKWIPLKGLEYDSDTPLPKATTLEEELGLTDIETDKVVV